MNLTRSAFVGGVAAVAVGSAAPAAAAALSTVDPVAPARGTPAEALAWLRAGNARFRAGGVRRLPAPSAKYPQRPWAVVLSCADTRVAPELVFDALHFGDLFVCRTAGNIADPDVTGSIEFAVAEFHAPFVLVLGHSGCGACDAAIATMDGGPIPPASIVSVVEAIAPAVSRVPRDDAERLPKVVKANAALTAAALGTSPILAAAVAKGALRVASGYHELATGLVTIYV
jgi:carbonic anhydrase